MKIQINITKSIDIDTTKSEIKQLIQIGQQIDRRFTHVICLCENLSHLKKFIENHPKNQGYFKKQMFIYKVMNVLDGFIDNDTMNKLFAKHKNNGFIEIKKSEKLEQITDRKDRLRFLTKNFIRQTSQLLRNRYKDDLEFLLKETSWMDIKNYEKRSDVTFVAKEGVNIRTRIHCLLNEITEFPRCLQCNNITYTNLSGKKVFPSYCSLKCANESSLRMEHYQDTCQKRFGSSSFLGSKQGQESIKDYFLENFGVEKASQVDGWADAIKANNNGVWPMATKEARKKAAVTRQKHIDEDPDFIAKAIKKGEQTSLKRYGARYKTQTLEGKKTSSEIASRPEVIAKRAMTRNLNYYNNILLKDPEVEALFSVDEYLRYVNDGTPLLWRCRKCGSMIVSKIGKYISKSGTKTLVRCYKCHPHLNKSSLQEKKLAQWLSKNCPVELEIINGLEDNFRVIAPYQLDILVREKKSKRNIFAIEYDGSKWHSIEEGSDAERQLRKTIACEKINLPLIHIYEDEWMDKKIQRKLKISLLSFMTSRKVSFQTTSNEITISRDMFSKCTIPENFKVIDEICPQIVMRSSSTNRKKKYSVPDCGYLVCKRVNRRCDANNKREN